jgi:hypothetical protein
VIGELGALVMHASERTFTTVINIMTSEKALARPALTVSTDAGDMEGYAEAMLSLIEWVIEIEGGRSSWDVSDQIWCCSSPETSVPSLLLSLPELRETDSLLHVVLAESSL